MSNKIKLQNALLVQAVTVNNQTYFQVLEKMFEKYYGKIEMTLGPIDFDSHSHYYEEEMGKGLQKMFYIFSRPVSLESFYRFKLESRSLESLFICDGKRNVNIDPGSLTLYQLSLLTTKAFSHRTYLAEGIYAECTLIAKGNNYEALQWTYPDYQTPEALKYFARAKNYLKSLQ